MTNGARYRTLVRNKLKITKKNLAAIVRLRNAISHNRFFLVNTKLKANCQNLCLHLPKQLRESFITEINASCLPASNIESIMPKDNQRAFKGAYLDIAEKLRELQIRDDKDLPPEVKQLEFDFVLFSSAIIDYDYIIKLVSEYTQAPEKMSRDELVDYLCSYSNMMDEREDIIAYIYTLEAKKALDVNAVKAGLQVFKAEKAAKESAAIAKKHGIETSSLQTFIDEIIRRMIFDGEKLSDLMEPLELGWKERADKEEELMHDLIPLLKKLAKGRNINGLKAYE